MKIKIRISTLMTLLLITRALIQPQIATYAQSHEKRVLVINSYHYGLSWTDNIVSGIKSVLANTPNLQLYIEYMDTKRFGTGYYEQLYATYQAKYKTIKLDAIILSDNDAFNFMSKYHDDLFPGIPVIFCGLNFFEETMIAGHEDTFTGVVEATDTQATLDIALKLHPNTRRIIVINDATTTGKIHSDILREMMPRYAGQVEFVFYEDPDMQELLPVLPNLPDDTLIFLILLNRDHDGQFYTYEQGGDLIFANTNRPIYGLWDFYLGHGLVGGKLANAFAQGEAAGQMALKILNGVSVADTPILTESPNRHIFDYQLLQKFNINESSLPPDSQIINKPPSLYEQYASIIWPVTVVVAALVMVIVIQLLNLRQRRKVETDLRLSNQELEDTRASLEKTVAERTRDLERRSTYLETSAQIGQAASSILDIDRLLEQVIKLIHAKFDLYHIGLFLVDETGHWADLRASAGEAAQTLMKKGIRLALNSQSMTGWCITHAQARVASEAERDTVRMNMAELPDTHSEAVLPLSTRGQVIGALDVQSDQPDFFDQDTIAALSIVAEQVAVAINNARLFAAAQAATEAERKAYGEIQGRAWAQMLRTRPVWGYQSNQHGTQSIITQELHPTEANLATLKLPVKSRDQVLGVIEARKTQDAGEWTTEEITLMQALSEQLSVALEGARLYQDTQRRAAREQLTGEVTARMRASLDIDTVLQTAVRELGNSLNLDEAEVWISKIGLEAKP